MPAPVLQVKRGALSNLPGLKAGEPAFTTDTFDFFVGIDSTTNNNKFLGSYRYWTKETSSVGSSVKLVEGTTNGSNYVALKAPNNIASDVTYVLPGTQGGNNTVLTNDGSGNLSWGSGSSNATFTGITTFSDTTDSTTKDNGAVVIEGGVGIEKSVNIGGNLSVAGLSTFYGLVVENNGINVSGFSTIYELQVTTGLGVGGYFNLDGVLDAGNDAVFAAGVNVTGIATVGTFKLSGTSGIGITGVSSSTTLAENSNSYLPTQAAVKAYVDAVDLTLGLNADTGGPSTVNTSQTLTISGTANEVETSVSGQTVTIGLPNSVSITTALTSPTVKATNVQANDGTTSITITNGTGAVGFANSVTIAGDLYVFGNTTEVNTSTLKVEDSLVDLGLINNGGVLVPPSSDFNIDIGVLFNWYSGSAKKAAVYWDDSAQRIAVASDVSESTGVLTASAYADFEIGSLWVTDCAGTSQVISCTGAERFLNNITIDAGTF